jgi:hypothetical protein
MDAYDARNTFIRRTASLRTLAPSVHPFARCRLRLTFVGDLQVWHPLSREEFRQLKRDDRVRDRGARVWTLRSDAYFDRADGEHRAVLVAGAQVLIERERFHDSYMLMPIA